MPPSNETSPQPRRPSQRSSQSSFENSQSTPKRSFKHPPRASPRKAAPINHKSGPQFKAPKIVARADASRITRSSAPVRDPLRVASANKGLTGSELQIKANVTGDKLGISDMKFMFPPSSVLTLPEPSTSLDAKSLSSSPLTSVSGDFAVQDTGQENDAQIESDGSMNLENPKPPSLCPFCKEAVDEDFMEERISLDKRLTIRQQAQFCKTHRKRAAEDEWKKLEYPTIGWRTLSSRLNRFHPALDDILQWRRPSFYRNAFEDVVQNRKKKTLRQDLLTASRIEELSPGYYGSRGARVMWVNSDLSYNVCRRHKILTTDRTENIMTRFTSKIRRLSASDNLISVGGVSEFVQAVLVPELAVLLIKEDMDIDDDERAREVLRNSVDIGHLLNEEEDEMIKDPGPAETLPVERF